MKIKKKKITLPISKMVGLPSEIELNVAEEEEGNMNITEGNENINYEQSKYFNGDVKLKDSEKLKRVPFIDARNYAEEKEGEYHLYDLMPKVMDKVIQNYILHNHIIRRYATDVLLHFTFDKNGKIIRGFDE